MHALPVYPIRLAVVSGALWCAWLAASVLVYLAQKDAPPPAAAEPPEPFTVTVRTIPIIPELAFDDRWQLAALVLRPLQDIDQGECWAGGPRAVMMADAVVEQAVSQFAPANSGCSCHDPRIQTSRFCPPTLADVLSQLLNLTSSAKICRILLDFALPFLSFYPLDICAQFRSDMQEAGPLVVLDSKTQKQAVHLYEQELQKGDRFCLCSLFAQRL